MTSDPKEALERLKAFASCAHVDTDAGREAQTCVVSLADLRTLIAKQEGLEREVERLKCRLTNAGTMASIYLGQREAVESKLSALPHIVAGLRFDLRMQCEFGPAFHQAIKDNLDKLAALALLPTVPVEGS